jgi:Tfp pilus assembly protein FimT
VFQCSRTAPLGIGSRSPFRLSLSLPPTVRVPTISPGPVRGFSTVEMVVAVAIILAISAVAIPTITKTLRAYQLTDAATQLAGILKFTRFEAIRRNTPISCANTQAGANAPASLWSDNNGDGVEDPTEKQVVLSSNTTLVPAAAVPGAAALATAVGAATLTAVNPSADSIRFDQRGAVVPPAVYVFYVGSSATPENGFRAVIVLPSGSVQVWTYLGGGTAVWQLLS